MSKTETVRQSAAASVGERIQETPTCSASRNWRLKRTAQCAKCPWRVDVDARDIPNGYDIERHRALVSTVAKGPIDFAAAIAGGPIQTMACHESPVGDETPCVGWLVNQLGPGNNIPLRLHVRHCENIGAIRVVGEQHVTFEDTLP